MSRGRRLRACVVLLAFAGFLFTAPTLQAAGLREGDRPPAFTLADLDGRPQSLKAYEGKLVLLHFWATWCPYCRKEIPKLKRIHEELASRGVVILAVSVDDDLDRLRGFVSENPLPYAVLPDVKTQFSLAGDYDVSGVPVTYLVDRDGRLLGRIMGPADLFRIVKELLDSPEDAT